MCNDAICKELNFDLLLKSITRNVLHKTIRIRQNRSVLDSLPFVRCYQKMSAVKCLVTFHSRTLYTAPHFYSTDKL